MGIVYTPEQQQVIDLHGSNILVSAAAGSGKTAVLTERIVKMISDETHPVDIDRLLVVTFTNAAAAEMRERISLAVAKRLETEPENEHLQKQATLIHNAQITTIDSFCMFVIRNNFNDIGLDPGFRVADEGELRLLKQDVMQELLEKKYAERDSAFLNCVEYFSTGNRDQAMEEHILKLYRFAESNPWPEEWLEERRADYAAESPEELNQAPFMETGMEQVRRVMQNCLYRLRECLKVCAQPDGPYMYGEVLEREEERLEKLGRIEKYEEGYALFQGMVFDRLPSKKDDSVSPYKRELVQGIRKEIKEAVKELCIKYFPAPAETVLEYMKGSREAVEELITLTADFCRALGEKKREENVIDFSDMEHLALSILVQRTEDKGGEEQKGKQEGKHRSSYRLIPSRTALDYRAFFEEILIDEYQDSNLVQEILLKSISGEEDGKYNRFMVGDVKQSIYKFRLARPEIFMEKYDSYGAAGDLEMGDTAAGDLGTGGTAAGARKADETPAGSIETDSRGNGGGNTKKRIDLHKNFRSRKEVLDGVNYIFSQIMGRSLGGVEYDGEAALYPGADYPAWQAEDLKRAGLSGTLTGSPNESELLLVCREEKEENGEIFEKKENLAKRENLAKKEKEESPRQREARAVAARIRELRRTFQVTDKESGKLRPVCYRDIVILLRTNAGWDDEFKSVLKEEGIPSHVASRTGYFSAGEIQTLLQLLRILDNPRQDIPLFGVLKSFFGGFDDEEIAWIRAGRVERKKCLYFYLKEFAGGNGQESGEKKLQKALLGKTAVFLEFLDAYRDKSIYMPIHELLRELIIKTGYLHYVSALPGGEQRKANVLMLLEKASAFEQTSYYGLFHFIRYIEQLEKYDVDYGEANILDENADVVRIMSIHKSKGLEFPVCFLCGLGKKFNMQDINGKMIADVDMGIGVDYVDSVQRIQSRTVRKNIIAEKMRLDNLGEELRVLYVAMTRAKEKLIMTGLIDKPEKRLTALMMAAQREEEKILYGDLAEAGSYLDFILPALARHKAFFHLWEDCGLEPPEEIRRRGEADTGESAAEFTIKLIGDSELAAEKIKEQIEAEGLRVNLERSNILTDMDNDLAAYMTEVFAYQYEHANLADLYTKTTVSELKKTGQKEEKDFSFQLYEEETVVPYLPKFMQKEELLGGAGRGSAFHKVMELLHFGEGRKSVGEQIRRMTEEGTLNGQYAQAVSVPLIEAFFSSKLAERMAAAERRGCLYREQPFVLGLPASELNESFPEEELVLIQGIIDVYFEEDGQIVVADYKTDRVDSALELAGKYRKQLDYYERALEKLTGLPVREKIIYSFALGEEIVV